VLRRNLFEVLIYFVSEMENGQKSIKGTKGSFEISSGKNAKFKKILNEKST